MASDNIANNLIIHMCTRPAWKQAQQAGIYRPSSLASEGFIHCSRPEQIVAVANLFYRGATDLVLLWIDPRKVEQEVRWEIVGEQVFPHIYGPLNLQAVCAVEDYPADKDGLFRQEPANSC